MALTGTELDMIQLMISRANDMQRQFIKSLIDVDVSNINVTDYTGLFDLTPMSRNAPMLNVGDRVVFKPRKTKPEVTGTIKSINGKTYTIVNCSDNGPGWRIGFDQANIRKAA